MKKNQNACNPARNPARTSTAGDLRRRLLPVLVAGCFGAGAAHANPVGPQVVNGQASFVNQGNTLSVTNSPGAIINWQSFSINQGEVTRFIQQNSASAVLNRITGQDPSQILGALQSNGRVFLINPNGILFGQGAQIDVNGLVASTLNLSNEDFLAGRMNFNAGANAGDLKNQGSITTPSGGRVYLIAPNVENSGIITSPQGEVLLAAGRSVQLVDSADPDLHVVVSAPDDRALNLGSVIVQGGKAGIYGALINQRGIVSADSAVVGENGKIVFKASRDTLLEAGSRTSATGAGQGGEIHVLGQRVALSGDANVDASGVAGGGTVLIGGDYQGGNAALPNAQQTYVGADAVVRADATDAGDGGKVVVWSDQATQAYGTISVRGGPRAGNGGLVETSGHHLDVAGVRIDASAAHGRSGDWLLDPYNIEVTNSGGSPTLTNFDQFADLPSTGTSLVSADALSGASANVMLQATHDITFTDPVIISAPGVGLTAMAGNNINVNSSIMTSGGAITLSANDNGGSSASGIGTVNVNNLINAGSGNVALSGTSVGLTSAGAIASTGGTVALNASAGGGVITMASGSSINTGGGQLNLTADDMALAGSLNAGSGSVALTTNSAGRPIDLGTDTAGQLGLTVAELSTITADKVAIGSANSGAIRITTPQTTNFNSLSLISGGSITQNPGAWLGGGHALRLQGSVVTLLEANPTGVIAGSTTSGDFEYHSVNDISISNVDGANGISVPGSANIKLMSDMQINQSAPLVGGGLGLRAQYGVDLIDSGNSFGRVVADLYYGGGGGGDLRLFDSSDLTVGGSLVVNGSMVNGITTNGLTVTLMTGPYRTLTISEPIYTGSGSSSRVDLQADKLVLDSTITTNDASIRPYSTGRAITVGSSVCHEHDPGDGACLSLTRLSNIVAPSIGIGKESFTSDGGAMMSPGSLGAVVAGPIYVEGITLGVGAATDRNAVTTRIGLLSGAGVSQGTGLGIDVRDLGAIAGGPGTVDLTNPNNKVSNLAGGTAGGNFSFTNSTALNITTLSGSGAGDNPGYSLQGVNAGSGSVRIISRGALSVNSGVGSSAGEVLLFAGATGVPGAGDNLTIGASGSAKAGTALVLAAGDNITVADPAMIASGSGQLLQLANMNLTGVNLCLFGGSLAGCFGSGSSTQTLTQASNSAINTIISTNALSTTTLSTGPVVTGTADSTDSTGTAATSDDSKTDSKKDEQKDTVGTKDNGAKKNESVKKMYCN
jgi:filamentous hemagglutinin family protein